MRPDDNKDFPKQRLPTEKDEEKEELTRRNAPDKNPKLINKNDILVHTLRSIGLDYGEAFPKQRFPIEKEELTRRYAADKKLKTYKQK